MSDNQIIELFDGDTINLPAEGHASVTYKLPPDGLVSFGFDIGEAVFTSNGNDLIISVEGQGTVIIENYQIAAQSEETPTFALMGGEEIPGNVYLFVFNEENNDGFQTAANVGIGGSGAGAYVDASGTLYRSLDRLGGQPDPSRSEGGGDSSPTSASFTGDGNPNITAPTLSGELEITMNEDGTYIINDTDILALVIDPDPGAVAGVTSLQVAGNGTLTRVVDEFGVFQHWTFEPEANFNGNLEISFTISDTQFTVNGTGTIEVLPVNDAPVVDDTAALNMDEDGSVIISASDILEGASDVDLETAGAPDVLTVASIALDDPTQGTLTNNGDGTWTFEPAADFNGTVEYSFTVSDGQGGTAEGDGSVIVAAVNDDPTVEDTAALNMDEDGTITIDGATILAGASDVDLETAGAPDVLSVASITLDDPTQGTLTNNGDGTWTFEPAADFNGTVEYSFTVSDGQGGTAEGGGSVIVAPVNDAPVVEPSTDAGFEDSRIRGTVADEVSDVDNRPGQLSYALAEGQDPVDGLTFRGNGSYVLNTSSYDYLAEGQIETITVNYTVTDGDETVPGQLTFTVTGTNDAPNVEAKTLVGVAEDATTSGTVADNVTDADDNAVLTYALAEGQAEVEGLTFNDDGSYDFDASSYDSLKEGQTQTIRVNYTVTDEHDASDSGQLVITITGTNDAPVVEDISTDAGLEDGRIRGTVADEVTDVDNGARLTFALVEGQDPVEGLTFNANGSYTLNTANYDYLADGQTEIITVNYTVTDEHDASDNGQLTFTVTGTNDAPNVEAKTLVGVAEDATTSGTVADNVTDADDNAVLTYALAEGQAEVEGLTFNDDGSYDFDASSYDSLKEGQTQTIRVNYTVTDEHDASDSGQLVITITGTNDAPVVEDTTALFMNEDGGSLTIKASDILAGASDVDTRGRDLSVSEITLGDADQGTLVDNGNGTWTFTPSADFNGTVDYSFTVTDGQGGSAEGNGSVVVAAVNDDPVVDDVRHKFMYEDGSLVIQGSDILAGASDVDLETAGAPDVLSVSSITVDDPSQGTLTDNGDGTWTFEPADDYSGFVSYSFTVTDGQGGSDTGAGRINVAQVNDDPILTFAATVGDNLITNGSFEDIDVPDGDWVGGQVPEGWTIVDGGRVEILDGSYVGNEGASDGENVFDFATPGGAMAISQDIDNLVEGDYLIELDLFDRSENVNFGDSGPIDVYWNGELVGSFNPDGEDWETASVLVNVEEGENSGELLLVSHKATRFGTVLDNVTMRSVDLNETNTVEIDEGVANGTYVATAIGEDIDSTDLTFSITDPDSPFAIDPVTGVITVRDSAALDGMETYQVEVTVNDGDGGTDTEILTIEVNEPPVGTDFTVTGTDMDTPVVIDFLEDVNVSDADGDVTGITISSLPDAEAGTLLFNGEPVEAGETYNLTDGDFTFEANTDGQSTLLLGTKDGDDIGLTNWGADSDNVSTDTLTQEVDGNTITVQSGKGDLIVNGNGDYEITNAGQGKDLKQYNENSPSHMGFGIGDKDGNGIEAGETITVDFGEAVVSTANIGFDGLGGHFDEGSSQGASAVWIAMFDGEVVGSGSVINDNEDGSLFEELTITPDMIEGGLFDSIIFTTDSDAGSNWELRYVEAEFGIDASFDYIPVDDDGLPAGDSSTVTVDVTPSILSTNPPESESFGVDLAPEGEGVAPGDTTAIDFSEFVSDVEDGDVDTIIIDSLPTTGRLLDGDGNPVVEGQEYNVNEISFEAPETMAGPAVSGVLLGARNAGDQNLDNWGTRVDDQTRVMEVTDDITVTVSTDQGRLNQYNAEAPSHMGTGIGDHDGSGINEGEIISVEFDGALVSVAEVSFDGLGGHFAEGGSVGAAATWVAYNGDTVVASGEVYAPEEGLENVVTIGQDVLNGQLFDRIDFSTDSDTGSNWELKYVDTEFGAGDSFTYHPVDSDGLEGNTSTVSLTYDAPDSLTNEAPTLDLGTGEEVTFDGEHAGYTNMLGIYFVEDGEPTSPEIILTNSNDSSMLGNVLATFDGDEDVHFFLVSNARGKGLDAEDAQSDLNFVMDNGEWALSMGNKIVDVQFDIAAFNPNGEEATFRLEGNEDGSLSIAVDDQLRTNDDDDFDDLTATVSATGDESTDYAATWVEGEDGVGITGDVTIADADSMRMSGATIVLTNAKDGDVLSVDDLPEGMTAEVVEGDETITVTLSGDLPLSEYQDAIEGVTFANQASGDPDVADRVIEITVTDQQGATSNTTTSTIAVVDVDVDGQIVLNPSFEAGMKIHGRNGWAHSDDAAEHWDNLSGDDMEVWTRMNQPSQDGDRHMELDYDRSVDSLSQVIATKEGEPVKISFQFAPRPHHAGPEVNNFNVVLGGVTMAMIAWNDATDMFDVTVDGEVTQSFGYERPGEDAWTEITLEVEAPVSNAELTFTETGVGSENVTYGAMLDNVQVIREFDGEVLGTDRAEELLGSQGDDFILGADRDAIDGTDNGKNVKGDEIDGQGGDDAIYAGDGNDLLVGGDGNDFIFAGGGDDTIDGGAGDDFINPGSGNALITTGEGSDTVYIDRSVLDGDDGEIVVNDFELGIDALELGEGMSVKDIVSGTEDSIDYTEVLVGDENGNDVVVKLLGVTQTNLFEHQSTVAPDATTDDLIQYMIDSGSE